MILKNFMRLRTRPMNHCHKGKGTILFRRVWNNQDFQTKWSFVDHTILPPGTSIGLHKHGENEEMYIILRGQGIMTVDGEEREIGAGDMILNGPWGTHGLRNDSQEDLEILVIEVGL